MRLQRILTGSVANELNWSWINVWKTFGNFYQNIEEACQEKLLEIRYDDESNHEFDCGGYENI